MIYEYFYAQGITSRRAEKANADSILKAVSNHMMKKYDLATALEKVKWDGLDDLHEGRIDGLAKMLDRIRDFKSKLLNAYSLDHALDMLWNKISLVCSEQLEALRSGKIDGDRGHEEKITSFSNKRVINLSRWLENHFPENMEQKFSDLKIFQNEDMIGHRLFPIYEDIWKAVSGFNFIINENCNTNSEELIHAIRGLRDCIESCNKAVEADFPLFVAHYSHVFNFMGGIHDWIDIIQRKRTALRILLRSVPYHIRLCLEEIQDTYKNVIPMAQYLNELWLLLDTKYPQSELKKYNFKGNRKVNLNSALFLIEKIYKLEELEDAIVKSNIHRNFEDINKDLLREILGEIAETSVRKLQFISDELIEKGYLNVGKHGYRLTSRALRKIGEMALSDIFPNFAWSKSSKVHALRNYSSCNFIEETKEYEYGDALNLNLASTVFNALRRNPGDSLPITIKPTDFEVYKREYMAKNSTVLLIDTSSSMEDKLPKAKKVALALRQLMFQHFPEDRLKVVVFYSLARMVNGEDLFKLESMPFCVYNIPHVIDYHELREKDRRQDKDFPGDFTNIQEGLRVSREFLVRNGKDEKHIFLITDGEPTACAREGKVFLECPPKPYIFEETLKEVKKCTRNGINITTFMLSKNELLRDFVKEVEKINRGKAFFTSPEDIERYVVFDYLKKKHYQIV